MVSAVPARAVTDDRMPRSARYLDGAKAGQLPSRLRLIRGDLENVAVLLRAGRPVPDVAGAPGPARSAIRSSPGSTARSPRGAGRAGGETGSGCHRGSPRADTPRNVVVGLFRKNGPQVREAAYLPSARVAPRLQGAGVARLKAAASLPLQAAARGRARVARSLESVQDVPFRSSAR